MEATNKWAYALGDEENYNDTFFDSKEAALDEAMDEARLDDVSTVYVGQVELFRPAVSITEELFDQLQDQAYDEGGDYSIGWLDDVTKADEEELNHIIEVCFFAWLSKHPEYKPKFFTITNSKTYEVGEGK